MSLHHGQAEAGARAEALGKVHVRAEFNSGGHNTLFLVFAASLCILASSAEI